MLNYPAKTYTYDNILYIYSIKIKHIMVMETMKSTKKTVIDLKEETFRILSVMAAQQGISLKNRLI